jgi:hypothetical protein
MFRLNCAVNQRNAFLAARQRPHKTLPHNHRPYGLQGAYSSRHIYSEDDMDMVVKYARNRGIDVMVEIDTPGHTYSWGHAAPHLLATCYNTTTGEVIGMGLYSLAKNKYQASTKLYAVFCVFGAAVHFSVWYRREIGPKLPWYTEQYQNAI